MRLDPKRTLDELIASLAPDAATRDRALSNRIYRELSAAVAGSQEFSAVAKLYELNRSGDFDAIVLDTPPSRNALDFLDAPARLVRFFDGRALRLLLSQSSLATRVASRAGAPLFNVLGRLTGAAVLREITAFFLAIGGMIDGLAVRAAAVQALLHEPDTTFVLVSSPRREALEEAIAFAAELGRAELTVAALVVNRMHRAEAADGAAAELESVLGRRLAALVRESVARARIAGGSRSASARAPARIVPQPRTGARPAARRRGRGPRRAGARRALPGIALEHRHVALGGAVVVLAVERREQIGRERHGGGSAASADLDALVGLLRVAQQRVGEREQVVAQVAADHVAQQGAQVILGFRFPPAENTRTSWPVGPRSNRWWS